MEEKKLSETQLISVIDALLSQPTKPGEKKQIPNAGVQVEWTKTYTHNNVQGIWGKFRILSTDNARRITVQNYEIFIGYFDKDKEVNTETLILWDVTNGAFEEVSLVNAMKAFNLLREYSIWQHDENKR